MGQGSGRDHPERVSVGFAALVLTSHEVAGVGYEVLAADIALSAALRTAKAGEEACGHRCTREISEYSK